MRSQGTSGLLKNEAAYARSLQLSRSAKHEATEPRRWGPAAMMIRTEPGAPPAAKWRGCLTRPCQADPQSLLAAELGGCFEGSKSGGGGVPAALMHTKEVAWF